MIILKMQVSGPLSKSWGSKPEEYPEKAPDNHSENGYHTIIIEVKIHHG